jgi:hypothetical protein
VDRLCFDRYKIDYSGDLRRALWVNPHFARLTFPGSRLPYAADIAVFADIAVLIEVIGALGAHPRPLGKQSCVRGSENT